MEPRIQYVRTGDGVSIAYWELGEGAPFVAPAPAWPFTHIEQEWQIPEWREWHERLAEAGRVVRYDHRGAGLSDRDVEPSFDGLIHDLETVADRLRLERIILFGCFYAAPVAIAYAARHPDRVARLILWCALTNPAESDRLRPVAVGEALDRLLEIDYPTFTETLAHTVMGWGSGEAAHRVALYMQASLSAEEARRFWALGRTLNVDGLLAQVQAPTLVAYRRGFQGVDLDVTRTIAARIPNAELRVVDGTSLAPFAENIDDVLALFGEFATGHPDLKGRALGVAPTAHVSRSTTAVFKTIMFTDIEKSTALTQALGDEQAQALVRTHNAVVRNELQHHGGSEIKHTGDGIMASFPSATAALESAIGIQRGVKQHNERHPERRIGIRIGLNAGEPVEEETDLFGTAVQVARRICDQAAPDEILVPEVVRQLAAGKRFLFSDRGEVVLRGFEDPVRVYEVRWREE